MEISVLKPQIDALFQPWNTSHSPGCALAVIQDGEIVYAQGYGMASLEFGIAITPQTRFQIGSISKQFTAMAIALLANDGKLSLDDDMRKYIPEAPDFGDTITIRHLVHHTSGLRGIDELMALAGNRMDDISLVEDYLDYLGRQRGLNFKPGEKHLYCNTGYTLMALIVERVSGMSMAEFCRARLFNPLGMRHTLFHDNYKMVVPDFADSYEPAGPAIFEKAFLTHGLPGSTSLITSVEDLLFWDREFYTGDVVGRDVIEQVHQPGVLNSGEVLDYAFGVVIGEYRGLKTVSHGGSDAGFRSVLLRFPEQRFSVIILSNLGAFSPDGLARKVADLALADQFTQAAPVQAAVETVELGEEQLQANAGLYYNPESELGASYLLEMRAGKLTIALGPGFELAPLSEDLFCLAGFDIMKMRFSGAGSDKAMMLLVEGVQIPYARVPQVSLSADEMLAYTGRYTCAELDTDYVISARDGHLWLKIRKHGNFLLQPTIADGFSLDLTALVGAPYTLNLLFQRRDGEIAGIMISSGRAKDLWFERV